MADEWRWPLVVRLYEPPSRGALAGRLGLTLGDLRAAYGETRLAMACVLDDDEAVVTEMPIPHDLDDDVILLAVLTALDEHPTLHMPPAGVWIEPGRWEGHGCYVLYAGGTPGSAPARVSAGAPRGAMRRMWGVPPERADFN